MNRPSAALLLALLASSACEDGPVDPGGDPLHTVEVLEGAAQVGAPGQLLRDAVVLRVVDHGGAPVAGVSLSLSTAPAGGLVSPARVRTDPAGRATARWRLADEEGHHVLEARGDEVEGSFVVHATAAAFPDVDALVAAGVEGDRAVGVLIDGRSAVGPSDDYRFLAHGSDVPIGDWRGDGLGGEVTVFVPGGALRHRGSPGFTGGSDTLRLPPEEPADVDLAVWLATGSAARPRVEGALLTASRIFEEEGLGVRIGAVEWHEVGGVPADLLAFTCPETAALREAVGSDPERIDLYIVTSVDGSGSRGQACRIGGEFIALAESAGPTLLAHELGHNFGLLHVDHLAAYFDPTNVMHSASDTRSGLTEGQIFRAQLNDVSALNAVYGHRPPAVRRSCFSDTGPRCPPMELRFWPDGSFAPAPVGPAGVAGQAAGAAPSTRGAASRGVPRTGPPPPGVDAITATLLETCGLHGGPSEAGPAAEGPDGSRAAAAGPRSRPDAATVRRLLEQGPPADVVARWREAAARRARADARWLTGRQAPAWLAVLPPEAVVPAAAAAAAEARLRASWRAELQKLR